MKTKALFTVGCLVLSLISVMGQQSEVRNVGTFRGIASAEGIDVYLKKGEKESVKILTDGSLSDVITEISGNNLKIHIGDRIGSKSKEDEKSVKVYVTYVEIDKISASTASSVFSDGVIKAILMEIHSSTAAKIELNIDATNIDVYASTAGDVTLEGKTKTINVKVNTSSEVDAYGLTSESCKANASTGGDVKVKISDALVAHADTGASIHYKGNPGKADTNSSSGGSVNRAN